MLLLHEQHLAPGQSADLAVQFFVDPDIAKDPDDDDVDTITLCYTMFRAKDDEKPVQSAALPAATPRQSIEPCEQAMTTEPLEPEHFDYHGHHHPYHLVDPSPWPIIGVALRGRPAPAAPCG